MTEIVDTVTWALCSAHSASQDYCRCKSNGSTIGLCSSTKRNAEIALSACRYHEMREALEALVADVAQYEAWQRPCAALDSATAALSKARGET